MNDYCYTVAGRRDAMRYASICITIQVDVNKANVMKELYSLLTKNIYYNPNNSNQQWELNFLDSPINLSLNLIHLFF